MTKLPSPNTSIASFLAMSQSQTKPPSWLPDLRLSQQPTARIEVKCERCARRGRFTAFKLYAEFGDLSGPNLLSAIAKKARCERAMSPPHPADIKYMDKRCEISVVTEQEKAVIPPTVYSRMHDGWRLQLVCARHHQGLKSAKPCPVQPAEMDLPTLVASLGHNFLASDLGRKLVAPCCATTSFELRWIAPDRS